MKRPDNRCLKTVIFLVIEKFRNGKALPAYERFRAKGRMLPAGLKYVDSWVEENASRCFQLMETDDPKLFDAWIECWNDLVEFEVIPVMSSSEASQRILPKYSIK